MPSSEYSGGSVQTSGCSHNTLCNYYGSRSTMAPVRAGAVQAAYLTPDYAAISYDALTHGNKSPGCVPYFNIKQAYGANAGSCNTGYTARLCKNSGCGMKQ